MALRLLKRVNLIFWYKQYHTSLFKNTYQINKTQFRMATTKDSLSLQSSPVVKTDSSLQVNIVTKQSVDEKTINEMESSTLQDPTVNTNQSKEVVREGRMISINTEGEEKIESSSVDELNIDQSKLDTNEQNQQMECMEGEEGAEPISADEKYLYFQRGFTSEIYKIEIRNLPPVGFKQLKKRLVGLELKPVKIKLAPAHQSWCFVTFRNEEDKQSALKAINGHVWKKKELSATPAKPAIDPLVKRKRKADGPVGLEAKKVCTDNPVPVDITERLSEAVTPLCTVPYEEQLQIKVNEVEKFLQRAAETLKKTLPGMWINEHIASSGGLLCPIDLIRSSPIQEEYRNKCEFTVGHGSEEETVVGFRLGSYKDGDLTVVSPSSCIQVPNKMKQLVEVFQNHIRQSSLQLFDVRNCEGHWKQLIIRSFSTGETMVIIQVHPQNLNEAVLSKEKQALVDLFTTGGSGTHCVPNSLYWQTLQNRTAAKEKTKYEHLMGEQHIHEQLLGVRFRVSPGAFFQVNSKASEVLYSLINELIASHNQPMIYDICCGTGTIGITLAKNSSVSKIIGIEISQQAIEDANHNAVINNVTNAEFICGKAEDVLPSLVEVIPAKEQNVIGILDPPRGGVHQKVIQAVRRCKNIHKLVYISCNVYGALNNLIDLCRAKSNRLKGPPFYPVKAIPVDMFPHTKHCEVVIVLERIPPRGLEKLRENLMKDVEIEEVEMKSTDELRVESKKISEIQESCPDEGLSDSVIGRAITGKTETQESHPDSVTDSHPYETGTTETQESHSDRVTDSPHGTGSTETQETHSDTITSSELEDMENDFVVLSST